ncbi:MAG: hypothetical protein AAF628_03760 [Planctomycetota bacterium]
MSHPSDSAPAKVRVGRAARGGITPVNREELPIILVPGIMGSRLHYKNEPDRPIWNPDSKVAMLLLAAKVTTARMKVFDVRTKATVFGKGSKDAKLTADQERRGWGGCAWKFYGKGLQYLEAASSNHGGIVYCFGYDWRDTNWRSGKLLANKIKEIRRRHRDEKVLIVTHSMGGLVTRCACALLEREGKGAAEKNVLGVVHTMQPANGTPLAYCQFKQGAKPSHWIPSITDAVLGAILGWDPIQFAAIASGTRAPFELMPNRDHVRTRGLEAYEEPKWRGPTGDPKRQWLTWDRTGKIKHKLPSNHSLWDIYKERTGRLGLIDYEELGKKKFIIISEKKLKVPLPAQEIAIRVGQGVDQARIFHEQRLCRYVHPNTSVVAGTDLSTDIAVHLEFDWNLIVEHGTDANVVNEKKGDGTVALESATCLPVNACPALKITWADRQRIVRGVKHADAFAQDSFNKVVWEMCQQVIKCAAQPTP